MPELLSDAARLRYPALAEIEAHARRCFPEECAGLLLAHSSSLPLRNVHPQPLRNFALDAAELARVLHDGLDPIGIYHSHPVGEAIPSRVDACLSLKIGWEYWIVSPTHWSRWCWNGERFYPLPTETHSSSTSL